MIQNECLPSGVVDIRDTSFGYTLSLIGGKYKMIIMYWLNEYEVMRYNQLKRCIATISHKTLSQTLKELEADQIILRHEYPQIPPKVEYALTERGRSLMPILDYMCAWGKENRLEQAEPVAKQIVKA